MIGNQLGSFAAGEDIEELASDVFVALWQAGRTLQTEHLRGWLGRVARNQAISFLRKQRLQLVPDEDYLLVDERDAQKLLEAQERSDLLRRALAGLSEEDRELFLRRYYYNQTAEQIAQEKHMNANTVRSRLARGRQALKAELQKGATRLKISVQSLFEDYEDDTVELRRDADTARILEKTMAKLPNARKKRPLRLVLIAAAAVAVLCGAAAIVHYASVEPAEQPYTLKSVFRDVDGTTIRQDIDFTQDGAVTFDTDGKTEGFFCGISQHPQQVNGVDAGLTSTLYESLSYADQYEGQHFLSSLSDEEKQQAKELVTCINYHDKVSNDDCSVECLSANDVAGVDLLLWGRDTTLVKEGTINGLYAAWMENTIERPKPDENGQTDEKQQYLFLYDPDKLCVVVLGGKWEVCETVAAELTIVQTDIPTPERDRDFIWVGALG